MSTDFFERQEKAHRSSWWLMAMFALAVIGIVGATVAVAAVAVQYLEVERDGRLREELQWQIPAGAGGAALALICLGSLFKVIQLRAGGGTGVAERLGGRRIYPNSSDPVEQQLLNVVEEMSLAAGIPVPPVFFLSEEKGINAFAAGYSPSDAVLGVTRGAAEGLTRDQLQGVIGHELSHVLNGDMRMNIRLIGVLCGILLLGLIGRIVVRGLAGGRRSSSSKEGGAGLPVIFLIGLALIVLGSLGSLIGGLIKAAVSRQREYLADASAVQFTRNPLGLAGALKRIGAAISGSQLKAPNAAEASHMYFSQGVWEGFTGLMATHPPLRKRILALDPQWDGSFASDSKDEVASFGGAEATGLVGSPERGALDEVYSAAIADSVRHIGHPVEPHREYAAELIDCLPPQVHVAARDPYGARAVLYALLLDKEKSIREQQYSALAKHSEPDVVKLTRQLQAAVHSIDVRARLPLVDMSLPALRALSPTQYESFDRCFGELVRADDRLGLFEWVLAQVLMRHLRPQFEEVNPPQVRYYSLGKLGQPCSVLLSTLAYAGGELHLPETAFAAGAKYLSDVSVRILPAHECGLGPLRSALAELVSVAARPRMWLVGACAATICADGLATVEEAELLRGIADLLDCPMPPILARQRVGANVQMTNDE